MIDILKLAIEGEREVQDGKWTIPAEVDDRCKPMAKCGMCGDRVWFRYWMPDLAICKDCRAYCMESVYGPR